MATSDTMERIQRTAGQDEVKIRMEPGSVHPVCKVLIVEDEGIVAADLERNLKGLGYTVVGIADRGREAIRLTGLTHPDLVLMDILLPGDMDGIDAAIEIQRRWQTPIVFLSANNHEPTLARAKQAGPVGYIGKPFRREELHATIAIALHQHNLARRLFDEHSWLQAMLGSIRDGVIATDAFGFVRYLNSAAENLTGWRRADAEGRPIEQVYVLRPQDGSGVQQCRVRRVLETGAGCPQAGCMLEPKSGQMLTIEDAATPIFDETGRLAGAVAVFHDTTMRERAEQEREHLMGELRRSNEELSRFSYSLAHDLRAPARTVSTLSEVLLRKADKFETAETHVLEMIAGVAGQMQKLIASLLAFAQVAQGDLKRELVCVTDIIRTVTINLHPDIEDSGATITCADLPEVVADRVHLGRVFQNLISNAIHYRRRDTPLIVRITGEDSGSGWLLSVSDNGSGIPPESCQRIFEPLHRLHGREFPGCGLGLALCRTIIARHGGRIWAESDGPNSGSTFRIFLPKGHNQ